MSDKTTADDLRAEAESKRAARREPALHADGAPSGYHLRGVSTLRKTEDGLQWIKTARDAVDPEIYARAVLDAIDAIGMAPRNPTQPPPHPVEGTLNVIPVGDPHFGMLSWRRETGADWDLAIAAETHARAFLRLMLKAPESEEALVVWMGDNAHADDSTAMTPRSGHILDVDSRWEKMLGVLFAAMINATDIALTRAGRVVVRVIKGNHDPHASAALALALDAHYRDEPRVTIAREPTPVYVHVWGRVLLAFAHGHAPKPDRVVDILHSDYRREIGATEQGYLYTGHVHSKSLKERGGLIMESVQTLAARDAYAAHGGWRSGRSLFVDTYRRDMLAATDRSAIAARDLDWSE